jgi:RNA polymerase sigma-70 factor (ECF subfamily)
MNKREDKEQAQEADYNLIKAVLENNRSAFNSLVLKYKDMVFNLCYRLLGDYDEANDCAQDIFIKVYRNLGTFKFQSAFSTWLYRIAVNTCKNHLSSLGYRMKKKSVSLDNPGYVYEPAGRSRDCDSNPAEVFEKKERENIIMKAIDSLANKEKILVVLRDIEGKSYEEIVDATGLKLGTVKSKLARARQDLREMLRGVI